jgi:hypothetical protein
VAPDGRPRLDGVIGLSRIRAVGGGAADGASEPQQIPSVGTWSISGWRTWPICPAGASGLLVRDSKGNKPICWLTRIDPGVVSLVACCSQEASRAFVYRRGAPSLDFHATPLSA